MLDLTDHLLRKAYSLSLNEYAVLIEIHNLSHNIKFGGWCVASKEYLADTLDLKRDTVYRAITKLLELELVEKEPELKKLRTTDKFSGVLSERRNFVFSVKTKEDELQVIGQPKSSTVAKSDAPSQIQTPTVAKSDYPTVAKSDTTNIHLLSKEIKKDTTYPERSSELEQEIKKRQEHGDGEINKMLRALKAKIGIEAFADSGIQRNIGAHCVRLMGNLGVKEFSRRLDIILSDGFKHKNCNRIRYVYSEIKGFIEPKQNKTLIIS
jgi:hypothetical protein